MHARGFSDEVKNYARELHGKFNLWHIRFFFIVIPSKQINFVTDFYRIKQPLV